jgi:hypothetical protein
VKGPDRTSNCDQEHANGSGTRWNLVGAAHPHGHSPSWGSCSCRSRFPCPPSSSSSCVPYWFPPGSLLPQASPIPCLSLCLSVAKHGEHDGPPTNHRQLTVCAIRRVRPRRASCSSRWCSSSTEPCRGRCGGCNHRSSATAVRPLASSPRCAAFATVVRSTRFVRSTASLTRGGCRATPATQSEIRRLGEISPAAKHAILRECKGGEELDGHNQPIARVRPSALIQAMQALFRHPTHLPGWDSPLDCAFAALPLLNNRVSLLERCELSFARVRV